MSHSLTRIWVHGILGTKYRQPLIKNVIREDLFTHIQAQMEMIGCGVRCINGTHDHIHVLFLLPKEHSIAQIMKSIKGESSHWINQGDKIATKFAWQVGYGGFSVSESIVPKVEKYIRNQEKHHRTMTFRNEYELLVKNHNLHINH
ncbi:MAG: IS200/IS605 family transposase [Candidatus Marinimicrobia bacterium]|nr:IS200/IS605 family transposase [FCB group bacterium]MBL7025246.1 IS200/IS605 family transposase [Candidatus Neomarinimicrobiota bacterium]